MSYYKISYKFFDIEKENIFYCRAKCSIDCLKMFLNFLKTDLDGNLIYKIKIEKVGF